MEVPIVAALLGPQQRNVLIQGSSKKSQKSPQGVLVLAEDGIKILAMPGRVEVIPELRFPDILLHAILRDPPPASIYCQIAGSAITASALQDSGSTGASASAASEDVEMEVVELKLIPKEGVTVEEIFKTMSQFAALHPDPLDEEEEGGEEGDENNMIFMDFEGGESLETTGADGEGGKISKKQKVLEHLESVFKEPEPGQFDDPE